MTNETTYAPTVAETAHLEGIYKSSRAHMSDAARIDLIRAGSTVEHTAFASAMDYTAWLLSQPKGTYGRGMLLMGDSGAGKSTFGEHLCRTYGGGPGLDRQIVMIDASGAINMRDVYGRVLQTLDGPVSRSMRTPDRELAVIRLLRELEVKALVVDEVQDIAGARATEQRRVLQGLKYLMNRARIPLICLGTRDSEKALITDAHLRQRLAIFHLPTWQVDSEFAQLLAGIQASLPLKKPSNLLTSEVAHYLIKQTEGSLRSIQDMIVRAATKAIVSGEESIGLESLKNATHVPTRGDLGGLDDAA